MNPVYERSWVDGLIRGMPRSPHQLNGVHESDAELVKLPGLDGILAVTTDGIAEEIASGLYSDPYLSGWMVVVVSASDLAAVGATPIGYLVCESLPPEMDPADIARLQAGIRDASRRHDLPVLGGDTNEAAQLHLSGTAIGIAGPRPLSRRGARSGDRLFASGALGLGSAFALQQLFPSAGHQDTVAFRPVARLPEGQLLRQWATACIDTSDGALAAMDELMRVNAVGIRATTVMGDVVHSEARGAARMAGLPEWTMLAGPHGEFELLFTIPSDRVEAFRLAAAEVGWVPTPIGEVVPVPGLRWLMNDDWASLDTTRIRNLFSEVDGDPTRFVAALLESGDQRLSTSSRS